MAETNQTQANQTPETLKLPALPSVHTRIVQKHDTSENWEKANNFIPLASETIFYEDLNKVKRGDGEQTVRELSFEGGVETVTIPGNAVQGANAFGYRTTVNAPAATAEGYGTVAGTTTKPTFEGINNYEAITTKGPEGELDELTEGTASHAEGIATHAKGTAAHAEGDHTQALATAAHAEGSYTVVRGMHGHAEGANTTASNLAAHAEGHGVTASAYAAHAEGDLLKESSYRESVVINGTTHSLTNAASGGVSHREGRNTTASADFTHAEGVNTAAIASAAHSEGSDTVATAYASHAGGQGTRAIVQAQTAIGSYNALDSQAKFVVGVGSSDGARLNSFTTGTDSTGKCYITVGNTILTEQQLIKILKFINAIEE